LGNKSRFFTVPHKEDDLVRRCYHTLQLLAVMRLYQYDKWKDYACFQQAEW